MNQIDLAWAAGLFEGEGSVSVQKERRNTDSRKRLRLSLGMTDEDVVRRFHKIVEIGGVYGPYQPKGSRKPMWYWNVMGKKGEELMWELAPQLGQRRRGRFLEVLIEVRNHYETTVATH